MNSSPESPRWLPGPADPFYRRVFALVAAAALGLALYRIIEPFLQPLAWAAILALLLNPLQVRLSRRLGGRPSLSALLLTLLVLVLFVGPLSGLAVAFAAQAGELAAKMPALVTRMEQTDFSSLVRIPGLQQVLEWLDRHIVISASQVQEWLFGGFRRVLQNLASVGGTAVLGAVGTVLSFAVMFFLLFFLLRDGAEMLRTGSAVIPMSADRKQALMTRIEAVTGAVVIGTVFTALVQGALLGLGFAIAGLPAPVVFGVLGAILSVVPFGGTALVWIPGAIVLFVRGDVGWGLFLAAWGAILVSLADNFLKPLFISGRAEVPTLAVFIGVIGGLSAFGLVGMFLGPIVIALALTIVRFASDTQLAAARAAATPRAEGAAPAASEESDRSR